MSSELPNLCRYCTSACCRKGIKLPFTSEEAAYLRSAGTSLSETGSAVDDTRTEYILESDCGNIGTREDGSNFCKIHEDPKRPAICGEFESGCMDCHWIRHVASLESNWM